MKILVPKVWPVLSYSQNVAVTKVTIIQTLYSTHTHTHTHTNPVHILMLLTLSSAVMEEVF